MPQVPAAPVSMLAHALSTPTATGSVADFALPIPS
jgi:hypothetical protein